MILCDGKVTKNIKGKKTDIKDCQWIQQLHSLGLLIGSFLPEGKTEELRTLCRHRANLLHQAANAIGNLKDSTPLRDFFQRIAFRKGRVSAISATARKLAVIIWNMVVKNVQYINPEGYLFLDQKRKLGLVKRIQKQITKFAITSEELDFVTN